MISKRTTFLIIIIFCFLALYTYLSHSKGLVARVKYVYDGDTILLENGERVRYLGIDAPEIGHEGEKSEFMAVEAMRFNIRLVKGRIVRLEFDKERRDRYGRLLAYVYISDTGEMVNAILLKKGFAHVLLKDPGLRYRKLFIECQREAMKKRIGIWSRPFRDDEPYYIGNRRSHIFHRPGCPFGRRTSIKNRVIFHSCYEAFWNGYAPCRRCRPAVYK